MFTLQDLQNLLSTPPFVPFRLHLSDGAPIDVPHPELALPLRRYAIIALPDRDSPQGGYDKHTLVWYFHVSKVEMLAAGPPPLAPPPPEGTGQPVPSQE
jgi:hypothetical protein